MTFVIGDFCTYNKIEGNVQANRIVDTMQNFLGCIITASDFYILGRTLQLMADDCGKQDGKTYCISGYKHVVGHALFGGTMGLYEKDNGEMRAIAYFEFHEVMSFCVSDDEGKLALVPYEKARVSFPIEEKGGEQ